jgi:hypothetical protein
MGAGLDGDAPGRSRVRRRQRQRRETEGQGAGDHERAHRGTPLVRRTRLCGPCMPGPMHGTSDRFVPA